MRDFKAFARKHMAKIGMTIDPYPIEDFDAPAPHQPAPVEQEDSRDSESLGPASQSPVGDGVGPFADPSPAAPPSLDEPPEPTLPQQELQEPDDLRTQDIETFGADDSPVPGIPELAEIQSESIPTASLQGLPSESFPSHQVNDPQNSGQAIPSSPNRGDYDEPPMDHTYNQGETDYRQMFSDILNPALEQMHSDMQMQLMESISESQFLMERRHSL